MVVEGLLLIWGHHTCWLQMVHSLQNHTLGGYSIGIAMFTTTQFCTTQLKAPPWLCDSSFMTGRGLCQKWYTAGMECC
jgi:L-rhamnose mutarotase